jgi:hypothetical protein
MGTPHHQVLGTNTMVEFGVLLNPYLPVQVFEAKSSEEYKIIIGSI